MSQSQYDKDLASAKAWIVEIGVGLLKTADKHDKYIGKLVDKAIVISYCASLPGDMPLRIRCMPNVFNLKA